MCIGFDCATGLEDPIPSTDIFQITLYGEQSSDSTVYNNMNEPGNKALSSVGSVKIYGTPSSTPSVRLLADAQIGDTILLID